MTTESDESGTRICAPCNDYGYLYQHSGDGVPWKAVACPACVAAGRRRPMHSSDEPDMKDDAKAGRCGICGRVFHAQGEVCGRCEAAMSDREGPADRLAALRSRLETGPNGW